MEILLQRFIIDYAQYTKKLLLLLFTFAEILKLGERMNNFIKIIFFSFILAVCTKFLAYEPFQLKSYNNDTPMVIIVPTYNNKDWYDRNLASIFTQKYDNYRVVIIDDHSEDKTASLIENYIQEHNQEYKCTLIRNERRCCKMANIYKAIHACEDHELIVMLDGDDWFTDDGVLRYLNELFQSNDIWVTAGGYVEWPSGHPGFGRPIPQEIVDQNKFRLYRSGTSAMRAFYAWLFKQIKLEDFFIDGHFFKVASDPAKMIPMYEMAGNRIAYNYRKVYVYNRATAINDDKVNSALQGKTCEYIFSRKNYEKLSGPQKSIKENDLHAKAAVVVMLLNPSQIQRCKDSLNLIKDAYEIYAVCHDYEVYPDYRALYDTLREYKGVNVLPFEYNALKNFFQSIKSDYIFFIEDNSLITSECPLNKYVYALEKTGAYAWYLIAQQQTSDHAFDEVDDNIYAFQYGYNLPEKKWFYAISPHTFDTALYRKKDIIACFAKLHKNYFMQLSNEFMGLNIDKNKIGIFSYRR